MRLIYAAVAVMLLCGHSWYEPSCCSGRDCFEIGSEKLPGSVSVTRTGYAVTVLVSGAQLSFHVAQPEARPSQDEKFHVCLVPTPGGEQPFMVRCFYAPPLGA